MTELWGRQEVIWAGTWAAFKRDNTARQAAEHLWAGRRMTWKLKGRTYRVCRFQLAVKPEVTIYGEPRL